MFRISDADDARSCIFLRGSRYQEERPECYDPKLRVVVLGNILWFCIGYSMCFGPTWHGIIGDPTYFAFLKGVSLKMIYTVNNANIPLGLHFIYQMMFEIITPALITGAFANRVNFTAYSLFLIAWLILVYFPFVHMVWSPNGLFSSMGVLDFAGGIVVHTTAGFAALASVIFIGHRCDSNDAPHNVPLMALGAGLLWFGWFGFNAGSELGVDWVAVSSFVNTQLGAAFAGVTWLALEWANVRHSNFVGLMTGAVAGLAAITPVAGYVSFSTAPVIGLLAGLVCYYAIAIKKVIGWDDALDVWGGAWCRRGSPRHPARCICFKELESTRCGRSIVGRHSVLSWAAHCRYCIGSLGVCLHLCGAMVD